MHKTLYLYVPGLGADKLIRTQTNFLKRWQDDASDVLTLEPKWHSAPDESYSDKKLRLENDIKKLLGKYQSICIFGSSAGGSMALNIFNSLRNEITSCVLISSKLKNPQDIGDSYRKRAPALYDSSKASEVIANQPDEQIVKRILSIRPVFDETVPVRDTKVRGARNRIVPIIGHFFSIGYVLYFKKKTVFNWNRKFI